jgi:hypothetical protein
MNSHVRLSIVSVGAALVFLFSGCASVPMAVSERDAKSKEFLTSPDRASIYIYRNENFGAAIPLTISVNKRTLGQTAARTFFHISVAPGRYTIDSISENVSTLNINVDASKNYFIWQEVKMGMWSARSAVQQVDDAKGRAGVLECKEIASTIEDSAFAQPVAMAAEAPQPQVSPTSTFSQQLEELETLRKNKSITEEEFQKMRAGLIEKYQK